MKTILLGLGKIGTAVLESFIKEKQDVTVIDSDAKTVESIVSKYDVKGIVGNGIEKDVLDEAGVSSADFFISTTPMDEVNIMCCILAKKAGAKYTVARVRKPEYFKEKSNIRDAFGIDMIINPEYRTAREIAHVLKFPAATSVETFASGRVNLIGLSFGESNSAIGKTVVDVIKENKLRVLFAAVKRGEKTLIPHGDFVFEEDDEVFVIGTATDLVSFCKKLHIFKMPIKTVFIVGGGKISYYLAKELESLGMDIKILEQDEDRCEELATDLSRVDVLLGDGTDREVLEEEDLENSDAFVALTGVDEENVLTSLYAEQRGVRKVITKVTRPTVMDMVKSLGLGTVVSPQSVIANNIIRFVRARQANHGNEVKKFFKLGENAEALEFIVGENFKGVGIKLKDLKLKKNVLIGFIVHGEELILPTGDSEISAGDRVLVVTLANQITDIAEILK